MFTFLLGAMASCPRRRDEGILPALPGACVTPGVNSYRHIRAGAAIHDFSREDEPDHLCDALARQSALNPSTALAWIFTARYLAR